MKYLKPVFMMVILSFIISQGFAETVTAPLTFVSVKGSGEFKNTETLLIDKDFPVEETVFDGPGCVYWFSPETSFVFDLGEICLIDNLTIQVDNNDRYQIDFSEDGMNYKPLLTIHEDFGKVEDGMDTLSTDPENAQYAEGMKMEPITARYLKVTGSEGDANFSFSELNVTGKQQRPVEPNTNPKQ
ncbi:hypothetical protein JW979_12935 [bacterium]|nr:hypothetical protein [candidate division CSSED10-310 bacterium]